MIRFALGAICGSWWTYVAMLPPGERAPAAAVGLMVGACICVALLIVAMMVDCGGRKAQP